MNKFYISAAILFMAYGTAVSCPTPINIDINPKVTWTGTTSQVSYDIDPGDTDFTIVSTEVITEVSPQSGRIISPNGMSVHWLATDVYSVTITVTIKSAYKGTEVTKENSATYTVYVVGVQPPLQYRIGTGDWQDMPDPLVVAKDTTVEFLANETPNGAPWPSGKPVWSGASGSGDQASKTFDTVSSTPTDFKFVSVECGNTVSGKVLVISVDIADPAENDIHLKGEEIKFDGVLEPSGLSGVTYAWSVLEGTCDPATASVEDFQTTLKSEGTIKVKLAVTVGGTTCEKERTIEAVLPNATKISWINDHDIYDHVANAKIDDPVWIKPLGGAVSKNEPGTYTRSGNAKAELEIEGSKALTHSTSVQVQGEGVDMDPDAGDPGTDENFSAASATFHNWTWAAGELQLLSSPLYASVNFYDTLEVKWQYRVRNLSGGWGEWVDMNQSSQLLYILLADPVGGVTVYAKLLDFTCHWAENENTVNGTFNKIWDKIDDRNATGYTYWGAGGSGIVTTRGLLLNGAGQCGAWYNFFTDINAVQGITVAKIGVTPKAEHGKGFLVKNAVFQEPPNHIPEIFPYDYPGQITLQEGIPGQGNNNPPKAFLDHALNKYGGNYYDPSYGTGPYATLHDWEEAALAGYINNAEDRIKKNDPTVTEVEE